MSDLDDVCEQRRLLATCKCQGRTKWNDHPMMEWRVTLSYQGRRMVTRFYQGMAHTAEPSAPDVVSCVVSDARAGEQSFEEFCDDFGYDSDSRKAHDTWKACVRAAPRVRKLLGDDFDAFANAEH